MTPPEWHIEARDLHAQGLSYREIAERLGYTHSAVWRACHPDRTREMTYRSNRVPGRQEAKNAHDREHRPLCECGAPMRRRATRCMTCQRAAEAALKDQVVALWAVGKTSREIADAIGWTPKATAAWISQLRAAGYDLPHRRPHMIEYGRRVARIRHGHEVTA
jgi:DNA-binding CsgD family transcriptional regulator